MNSPRVLVIVTLIAVGLTGAFFLIGSKPSEPDRIQLSPEISSDPLPTPLPSDWSTGVNDTLGFSISFPPGFKLSENGPDSITIEKDAPPLGAGSASFIYLTVIPSGKLSSQGGEYYNFNGREYELLSRLNPEEATSTADIKELEGYYRYNRLRDEKLAGITTRVYVNSRPWEFPQGTREYRYYLEKNDRVYLFGGYLNSEGSDDTISEPEFNLIKNTLKLQ